MGEEQLPHALRDLPRRQSLRADAEGGLRGGVQNLRAPIHDLPLEGRDPGPLQGHGGLPELRAHEECVPDVLVRLGVRLARPGPRQVPGGAGRREDRPHRVARRPRLPDPGKRKEGGRGHAVQQGRRAPNAEALGADDTVLQAERGSHLHLLRQGRVQSRAGLPFQARVAEGRGTGEPEVTRPFPRRERPARREDHAQSGRGDDPAAARGQGGHNSVRRRPSRRHQGQGGEGPLLHLR
mmetsp:Transcript_41336/g.124772  ORF Transcript_41336/g.124772 Transcript_41336/m.124772 type:complete len:238 (-) Transcript_41336:211-924(-)